MNTRPSTSRQNSLQNLSRSIGLAALTNTRSVYRTPKRWQTRQRRPAAVASSLTSKASLVQADILLRQQALSAARQGDYERAIAFFNELIERNPVSANDYNNRGLAYFQAGQKGAAIADYNHALQLNPGLGSVYNNRANYYAVQGQLLDAILDYSMAIELEPNNIRAWINQGITFRDLQMYDRAIECFDLALTLNQLEGHVYGERGRVHHLRGDWNCAIADYERAIAHLPHSSGTNINASVRLRLQIEFWLSELLTPLQH
jgi:tetratricopeptide (TPR) repeat protein